MPHRTFFWFIAPSMAAMIVLIALPLVGAGVQSVFREHQKPLKEVENCTVNFLTKKRTCVTSVSVDVEKLAQQEGIGEFAGLDLYADYQLLALETVGEAWRNRESVGKFVGRVFNLPFYNALVFTLSYTFLTTPLHPPPRPRGRLRDQQPGPPGAGHRHLLEPAPDDRDAARGLAGALLDDRRKRHSRKRGAVSCQRPRSQSQGPTPPYVWAVLLVLRDLARDPVRHDSSSTRASRPCRPSRSKRR